MLGNNLPHRERKAIKELEQNTNITVEKADKGTTTVIINKDDKIRDWQVLLDQRENYESLALPIDGDRNISKSQGTH